jgi:hypothetical protein
VAYFVGLHRAQEFVSEQRGRQGRSEHLQKHGSRKKKQAGPSGQPAEETGGWVGEIR